MNKSFWNMFTAKTRRAHNFEFQRFRMHSSEPRIAMMQKCDCATHETCLTMKARSVESPADNDQLETRSGTAHAVMAYLGVVATAVVYWASAIRVSWGRGGVERACVLVCVCVWTPPHPLVFLLREGKHVSSHYRRCVWGEQGAVCLRSALQSFESHPSRLPARSPAQSGSVCRGWEALARVIALWGIAPALFACLFTFRLVCHLVSSVFLCHLAAVAWQAWRCLSF